MSKRTNNHRQQPDPDVDVVPGDPPVPVNVWRLPAGEDTPIGDRLATRLLAEYTRPGDLVYDTLTSGALRKAAKAADRSYRAANRFQPPAELATLAVAAWPVSGPRRDPVITLGGLRRRLRPGGYLAVIVTPDGPAGQPVELGPLVADAIAAGLSYLQHIVTMPTPNPPPTPAFEAAAGSGGIHERVHTDVLLFTHTGGANA